MDQTGTGSEVNSEQDIHDVLEVIMHPILRDKMISIVLSFEKCWLYWIKRKFPEMKDFFLGGSFGEGLSGLSTCMQKVSDVDAMGCVAPWVVVERQHEGNYSNAEVLKLENSHSHPGYAFLKILDNDTYETDYFSSHEIRNIHESLLQYLDFGSLLSCIGGNQFTCEGLIHGPAFMFDISPSNFQKSPFGPTESFDLVIGIPCNEWPSVADEWIERKRSSWPSGTIIAKAVEMGCYLVPTGATGNSMEDNEWRISLIQAERLLIHTLNPAQLKTFALLKIVLKTKVFGEIFHNKISSYVAKTAFFWVSEEYSGDQWEESDCLMYLRLCLRKVLHFVTNQYCPNYFIRGCNVLREKLNNPEKQSFMQALDNFTREDNFHEKISGLPIIRGVRTAYAGMFYFMKTYGKCVQFMNFIERFIDRALEEQLGRLIFICLSTPTTQNLKGSIFELWSLLRSIRFSPVTSDISMNSIALQDFFTRCLTCAQLRVVNTVICRKKLSVNKRFYILQSLLSYAKLEPVSLCAAEITQIAHVFFSNALYENALQLIIPMLEQFKNVSCTRLNSINSFLKIISSGFFNITDVSFTSPRRPVCDIIFFSLEEPILTEHLRIEMVSAELGYEMDVESGKCEGVQCLFYVYVHPLVYACYMKYKCCRYMERNIDSCRALQELEHQVLEFTEHDYYNLNLLGCSQYESGNFEKAIKIFALAYRKRLYRISVFYHVGILLRRCFKDNYKTVTATN